MFKKKPSIRPFAPLRSSDRRKITDEIVKHYQIEVPQQEPSSAGDNGDDQTNALSEISNLRNRLLPDGSLSAHFSTTVGKELDKIGGTIFVGTYPGEEQRILWVKLNFTTLYTPTVYTLWHNPGLIPLLHTPDAVLQKMRGGADLMTPGLARGPPFPPKATKGAIVAVASLEKPDIPMVVGVCKIDISDLQKVQGVKGNAVEGTHWVGDELWAWSHGRTPGGAAPESIPGWDDTVQPDGLSKAINSLDLEESNNEQDDGGVKVDSGSHEMGRIDDDECLVEGEDIQVSAKLSSQRDELSTKEIDEKFRGAFLYALHRHKTAHKNDPSHGLEFPLALSLFMSHIIRPFLPIFTPEDTNDLQIKKTSWKTIKKFVKILDKEKLLKSKDRNGGETVILGLDFDNQAVLSFAPYKLPKKDAGVNESSGIVGGNPASQSSGDNAIGQTLKIDILLKPKEKLTPIFEVTGNNSKSFYLPSELRPIVLSYIEAENLISDTNKRLVNLNPLLANAVFDGQNPTDKAVLAKGSVPRDALLDRINQTCATFWVILRNNESRNDVKPKAGSPPSINITLETRSGNKTVTKISGVEPFFIDSQLLSDELQKACASSTSVSQLVGSSPKNPVQEIMVQGSQKESVVKALEKRGVHRNCIRVLDKTKGKKK